MHAYFGFFEQVRNSIENDRFDSYQKFIKKQFLVEA